MAPRADVTAATSRQERKEHMTPTTEPSATAKLDTDLDMVVCAREAITPDVITLTLRRDDGEALPEWEPGAHIDLVLSEGLVRQYSLCGDPRDRRTWTIAVLREVDGRGGSKQIHETVHEGSRIRVRGPRNHFRLEPAPGYIFIAGGIGITPLVPMLTAASEAGAEWHLTYGARHRRSMAFADRLRADYGKRVTLHPQETHGHIDLDSVLGKLDEPDEHTLVYCCGPSALLDAVEQRCPPEIRERLHTERFRPVENSASNTSESFEVQIDSTGEVLTVGPDETILDVLRGHGYPADASCEEGTCGTCETAVLAGAIDHRDSVLTPSERQQGDLMMVCVSRAACSRLVLDL